MKKRLLVNFIYQASYQILLIIIPMITIPIISRALLPEGVGIYNFTFSIVSYFVLVAGLGLLTYGVKEIAIVRDSRDKLSEKFWELALFNLFFSILAVIAYLITILFFPSELRVYFLAQGFTLLAAVFDITWFFSGIEDFKVITIRKFFIRLITFILIVVFIRTQEDLLLYILIQSVGNFVGQLSLWVSINKRISFVKVSFKNIKKHFYPALSFFGAKLGSTVFLEGTKTVLGFITTMSVVGLFSNSLQIAMVINAVITASNTVLIPYMSNLYKKSTEHDLIKKLQEIIHLQLYFTIAIMFGLLLVNTSMIDWFFGESFSEIRTVLPFMSVIPLLSSLHQGIANQYLVPKGIMRPYNISIILAMIVSLVLTATLSPFIGIYGGVIGLITGYLVLCFIRIEVLLRETEFKFDMKKISVCTLSGALMLGVGYIVTNNMPSEFITTVIQVLLGGLIYMAMTWILGFNPIFKILSSLFSKES